MTQRLGVVGSEAIGLQCFACVHGTDGPPDSCPHSLTLVDGREHVAEVHEDKIGGDFLISATPLRDGLGRLIGSVHVARDITQRKRTEEKVRHQNAVLEGINRILGKALTCDSEEQLGRACLEVVEEVTESSIGFLDEVNAEGGLDTIAINAPHWGAGRMPGSSQRVSVMGLKVAGIYGRVAIDGHGLFTNDPRLHPDSVGLPEGHPLLHAFLGAPLKHDGKTIGLIGVGNRVGGYRPQDLEALEALALPVMRVFMWKRAERAVRAGEERLRQAQKMESIGILAGGVAHDFNNLLVGVVGNASLAKEMLPPDNPIVELLEGVMKTGEQAAHLTRQMLAYAGKGALVVERLRLSALIPEMNRLVRPLISKKIALRLDLDDDSPPIEADRGQIQQVFMNLALNAAEAMDGGEGLITVKTGVENVDERYIQSHPEAAELRPGEYAFLEVCDNGCGMDDATRARIFDPFFSTKFTGRGLGLAAVAGIVRSHKGAIAASSAPGQGSCFRVLFPAATRAAGEPADPAHTAPLQGSGVVLVVDDEPIVREMAKRALERHGYTVLAADSGLAAIDVLKRHPGGVALVILDLSMPHMDGEEALPELRKIRPGVKVVVSSGYSEAETMSLFEGQQVSGFIQKPYTSTGLAEKVKDAIG
jgi:signal transduction histidine kinase